MRIATLALLALLASSCEGCRKSVPVQEFDPLPYPECEPASTAPPELLVEGVLHGGPRMRFEGAGERYRLVRDGCLHILTVNEWSSASYTQLEIVYDLEWEPLRVWRRIFPRGSGETYTRPEVRVYDLRAQPVTIRWRKRSGELEFRELRGPRPIAVMGTSRATVLPWVRRAGLPVGGFDEGPVLDIRARWDEIDDATLHRGPNEDVAGVGNDLEVYRLFGSRALFVDSDGRVVGDLEGLVPFAGDLGDLPPAPEAEMDTRALP